MAAWPPNLAMIAVFAAEAGFGANPPCGRCTGGYTVMGKPGSELFSLRRSTTNDPRPLACFLE